MEHLPIIKSFVELREYVGTRINDSLSVQAIIAKNIINGFPCNNRETLSKLELYKEALDYAKNMFNDEFYMMADDAKKELVQ